MTDWRGISAGIIFDVIREVGFDDERALNKALRDAYPFGQRKYHPYKIWLDEIRRQKGLKPPLGSREEPRCDKTIDLFSKIT